MALLTCGVMAQTTAATSGTTSSGTVPVFNGTTTIDNSPISVFGGGVGIAIMVPAGTLDVSGSSEGLVVSGGSLDLRGGYSLTPLANSAK